MTQQPRAVTRLDYCQYLLGSQINYTLTNFAEHCEQFSRHAINRYLANDCIEPRLLWEPVCPHLVLSAEGYIVFDDTVLDKNYSFKIDLVRRQYSGNAHDIIKGIGVVTCVYINAQTNQFWVIDYRIYDPDGDGKTKLDQLQEMLTNAIKHKELAFRTVLMDTWYATKDVMLLIKRMEKIYYCRLKDNRQVDDSLATKPYQRVDRLRWSESEQAGGKLLKIKGFPRDHKVKCFRVVLSTKRTDYVATNDHSARLDDSSTRGVWLALED